MCRTSLVFLGAVFAAFLQTQTAVALGLGSDSPLGNEAPTVSVQATPSSFPEPPSTLHPADASAALPSQLPRKQTVIFLRHGSREDHEKGRLFFEQSSEPWNPPLAAIGHREAEAAGRAIADFLRRERLPPIEKVYTSPYKRCVETSFGAMIGYNNKRVLVGEDSFLPVTEMSIEPAFAEEATKNWYGSWAAKDQDGNFGGSTAAFRNLSWEDLLKDLDQHVDPRFKKTALGPVSSLLWKPETAQEYLESADFLSRRLELGVPEELALGRAHDSAEDATRSSSAAERSGPLQSPLVEPAFLDRGAGPASVVVRSSGRDATPALVPHVNTQYEPKLSSSSFEAFTVKNPEPELDGRGAKAIQNLLEEDVRTILVVTHAGSVQDAIRNMCGFRKISPDDDLPDGEVRTIMTKGAYRFAIQKTVISDLTEKARAHLDKGWRVDVSSFSVLVPASVGDLSGPSSWRMKEYANEEHRRGVEKMKRGAASQQPQQEPPHKKLKESG